MKPRVPAPDPRSVTTTADDALGAAVGFSLGDLDIDPRLERVSRASQLLELPKLSFDLLLALAREAPAIVSVDTLLDTVWRGRVVGPETVTQRVKLLRDALGDTSSNPRYIEGVRGYGYRVIAPVTAITDSPAAGRHPMRRSLPLAASIVIALTIAGMAVYRTASEDRAAATIATVSPAIPRAAPERSFPPSTRGDSANDLYLQVLAMRGSALYIGAPEHVLRDIELKLNRAIELEPGFSAALAERAVAHMIIFLDNMDPRQERLDLAIADLDAAANARPMHPKAVAARGFFDLYVEGDPAAAIEAFKRADKEGLEDPMWLTVYAEALLASRRPDEAMSMLRRVLAIDQDNAFAITMLATIYASEGRLRDAIDTLDYGIEQQPDNGTFRMSQASLIAGYTGDTSGLDSLLSELGFGVGAEPDVGIDNGVYLGRRFNFLISRSEFDQLIPLLDSFSRQPMRATVAGGGQQPIERLYGWAHLLTGDAEAAVRDGRGVLRFAESAEETRINRPYLRLLEAEGYLFTGDGARAEELADEARALVADAPPFLHAQLAHVYAWAGATAKSLDVLDAMLASAMPPSPGNVTRDLLLAIPLRDSVSFQERVRRLENQMAATRLSLER